MDNPTAQEDLRKSVRAVVSWMHWFAIDKGKATNCIYAECNKTNSFSTDTLREGIRTALGNNTPSLVTLPSRKELADFMMLPQSNLDKWDWWNLANDKNGQVDESRKQVLMQVIFRIIGNKEFLLYAQRDYLNPQFENYDPSEKDMWQDTAVPLKTQVNIDDYRYWVVWKRVEVEQVPVKWAFSRRA
jgi:hypothetical protein